MVIDFFSLDNHSLMDIAALSDHMKVLLVSPRWCAPTVQSSNSVDRHVAPPPKFIKSLDPFGALVDCLTLQLYINPWSDDYFIGGVEYLGNWEITYYRVQSLLTSVHVDVIPSYPLHHFS